MLSAIARTALDDAKKTKPVDDRTPAEKRMYTIESKKQKEAANLQALLSEQSGLPGKWI